MTAYPSVLGIIPARSGSKGIPGKNTLPLLGKPLIAYTIAAAHDCKALTRCIVSTEDKKIAELCITLGADVPFLRPAELATDDATAMAVLQHTLQALKEQGEEYDYVAWLQPTSPLRTADDITACIRMAAEKNADSVFSMKKLTDFSIAKLKRMDTEGRILPLQEAEEKISAPRGTLPDVYKRNCAIYLTKTSLIENGDMFGEQSFGYIMPEERSIDINEPVDFELAEFWMNKRTHGA